MRSCETAHPRSRGEHESMLVPFGAGSAHPRSRGEHGFRKVVQAGDDGSSPLARGTPYAALTIDGSARLIPARAGNTCHSLEGP